MRVTAFFFYLVRKVVEKRLACILWDRRPIKNNYFLNMFIKTNVNSITGEKNAAKNTKKLKLNKFSV